MDTGALTTSDVAAFLDLAPKTVAEMCQTGKIRAQKVNGRWVIPFASVRAERNKRIVSRTLFAVVAARAYARVRGDTCPSSCPFLIADGPSCLTVDDPCPHLTKKA